jgi:ankyrin repeat protein
MLVDYLVQRAGANCNKPNDSTRNALLTATRRSQLDVVKLLLDQEVDINYTDANGCNALHIACT